MDGTINGVMLYTVTVAALHAHLTSRVSHHQQRAEDYAKLAESKEAELAEQLTAADTVTDRVAIKSSNVYSNAVSSRDQLRAKVQAHARSAARFEWQAAHLPDTATFDITLAEAVALELVPGVVF